MRYILHTLSGITKWVFWISLVVWIATWFLLHQLPAPQEINRAMYHAPLQTSLKSSPFRITYQQQNITVVPVATYEMWGLVVSHNDPSVWYRFDLAHDKQSIDTRDLCILWGNNLKSDDYRHVSFHNDDYYCGAEWSGDQQLYPNQFSNNHLITNNESIRQQIAQVNIGDQIHIKGLLVNYSEQRWSGRFRNTSTSREDTEMGACEIIFVTHLDIINSHNHQWDMLHRLSQALVPSALVLGVLLFILL